MQLPKVVQEFANIIGLSSTLQLVDKWGGQRIYFAHSPSAQLVDIIGDEAAAMLCAEFGGEVIQVPRCAAVLRARRDLEIRERHNGGESFNKLAAVYKMTERNISRIISSLGDTEPEDIAGRPRKQLSLFD